MSLHSNSYTTCSSSYLQVNKDVRRRLIRPFLPISKILFLSRLSLVRSLATPTPLTSTMAPVIPSPIESLQNPLTITIRSHRSHSNSFLRQPLLKHSGTPLSPKAINGAYATFISKDEYLPGALVLAYCHHITKSIYPFIILATPSLSQNARAIIKKFGITLIDIETLVPAREQYDPSVTDTRFRETWTKLR